MAPSRYDWKIVDWDVKPQHNQPYIDKLTLYTVYWQLVALGIQPEWHGTLYISDTLVNFWYSKSSDAFVFK